MIISITKRNYLLHTVLLTVLIGGIGGWIYFSIFPYHYFGGYPLIPIYYFVFGAFMISMVENCRHRMPKRMLQIYFLDAGHEDVALYYCDVDLLYHCT